MVFYYMINVAIVMSSIIFVVSTHKTNSNNSHHVDSDLLKRLQELEQKQGLSDRNAARLEHIVKTQADFIQEQTNKLIHLDSIVKKQATRTAHVLHIARENRHRTFLISKVLAHNNLTDEHLVLGNQRGQQKGQGHHASGHVAKDGHHGKGKNNNGIPRQHSNRPVTSRNNTNHHHQHHNTHKERQHDENGNNRNHQKHNRPVTSHNRPVTSHNTNNHHLHQSQPRRPSDGNTNVNSESPTRHQSHQPSGSNGRNES